MLEPLREGAVQGSSYREHPGRGQVKIKRSSYLLVPDGDADSSLLSGY